MNKNIINKLFNGKSPTDIGQENKETVKEIIKDLPMLSYVLITANRLSVKGSYISTVVNLARAMQHSAQLMSAVEWALKVSKGDLKTLQPYFSKEINIEDLIEKDTYKVI